MDTAFSANIAAVQQWLHTVDKQEFLNDPRNVHVRKANVSLLEMITYYLNTIPALRPSSENLATYVALKMFEVRILTKAFRSC